jgi:hypothetical protein
MRLLPLILLALPFSAFAGAKGSSHKKDSKLGATYWAAPAAIDGKLETAWQVPGEAGNEGQWIEIVLPASGTIDKVVVYPGFGKDPETFAKYARLKKLRLDAKTDSSEEEDKVVGTTTVEIADKAEFQTIDIADIVVSGGTQGAVRFTVEAVSKDENTDFENFALSEIAVVLKEFDAIAVVESTSADGAAPAAAAAPSGKGAKAPALTTGSDKAYLTDTNAKTAFTAPAGVEINCRMGTFSISSIGFVAPDKNHARPKTVEIRATETNGLVSTVVLADKPGEAQWAQMPFFNGFNGGYNGTFTVKVVDTYPGLKSQDVAIAELKARATSNE